VFNALSEGGLVQIPLMMTMFVAKIWHGGG
jgi:hypothetical protein